MRKYFNFKNIALFFSIIFLISSCNSDDKKNEETTNSAASTTTATSTNTADAPEPKKAALTGTLDYLWAVATEFKDLQQKKKVVFSFTFRDAGVLTLWGWQCKNEQCTDEFSNTPDIEMNRWKASNAQYGPNVIFGNVVIPKDGIKPIQDWIDKGYGFVVFEPYNSGEYIKYKIKVTKDQPNATLTDLTLEDTGIETNPSPPKNNAN